MKRLLLLISIFFLSFETLASDVYSVKYSSNPSGASLICNGINYGKTPKILHYNLSEEAKKSGYIDVQLCDAIWQYGTKQSYATQLDLQKFPDGAQQMTTRGHNREYRISNSSEEQVILKPGIRLFAGISYNRVRTSNKFIVLLDRGIAINPHSDTNTSKSASGVNFGVIVSDNLKVSSFYFSKETNTDNVSVFGASIDYSFNNYGIRRGWYAGAGLSNVQTTVKNIPTGGNISKNKIGLLVTAGYEHQLQQNWLFNVGAAFNVGTHEYNYVEAASGQDALRHTVGVNSAGISINYLF